MKLRVKNFRCYTDREFDFGSEGLVLLFGVSGAGKSSILMAIVYALYGTGKKVVSRGATTCKVELEIDNLKIVRTQRPNRLLLTNLVTNEQYEDDSAQAIITNKFGPAFEITSYIQQNAFNSFIMMSPTDKLEFLEKFAFTSVDLTQLKERCRQCIAKYSNELSHITGQLESTSELFQKMKKPERVVFPLPVSKAGKEQAIKNEQIREKNSRIMVKRTEKELIELQNELQELKIFQVQTEGQKDAIHKLKERLEQTEESIEQIDYIGDEAIDLNEKKLNRYLLYKEFLLEQEQYKEEKERLEEMQNNEIQKMKSDIGRISKQLWSKGTEKDLTSQLNEYKSMRKDVEELERLKKQLVKYANVDKDKLQQKKDRLSLITKEIEEKKELYGKAKLQSELYECPSCHTTLRFNENELHVHDSEPIENSTDDIHKDITGLSKEIAKLQAIIPEEEYKLKQYIEIKSKIDDIAGTFEDNVTIESIQEEIDDLEQYCNEQYRWVKEIKNKEDQLRSKNFSEGVQTFKNRLSSKKERLKVLESKTKEYKQEQFDEEELRSTIQQQRQDKEKYDIYQKQLRTITAEHKRTTEELDRITKTFLQKYSQIKEIGELETEMKSKELELKKHQADFKTHEENMKKVQTYQKYKDESKQYTEMEARTVELQKQENKLRQQYTSSLMLKDKILEAESLAITNIINSINSHAQEYLDIFFPHDPIVVQLHTFKESKKTITKPQINLEINYKGMESELGMLSGGERDRVILAFCLSLAEIFNSPLILLDECTSSLDQEMNSTVLEGIRKNFTQKLVLVIAHQVVTGDFDRQIML